MAAAAKAKPASVPVSSTISGGKRFFAPVPYALVNESEVNVAFGDRAVGRNSYYGDALQALIDGDQGLVIRFDSSKARSQVNVRAKKMGVKCLFAEQNGKLYVKLSPVAPASSTQPRKPRVIPQFPLTVRDAIRKAVWESPRTNAEVCDRVIELIPSADRAGISTQLNQLRDKNEIAKSDDMKWRPTGVAGKG